MEKEQNESALSVRVREANELQTKIEELRDPAAVEEQMAKLSRQCTSLEAMRLVHEEETLSTKRAVQEEINAALDAISAHESYVDQKLNELEVYRMEAKQKAEGAVVHKD